MARHTPKVEIGRVDGIKLPATQESLTQIQSSLEGFGFLEGAADLTAGEIVEIWDLPTNWPDDRVVGRRWQLSDENGDLRVSNYDREARKKLGEFFAAKRANAAHFHLHGQLNFWRTAGGSDFSGIMYFLGDGDQVEDIQIFSEYTHAPNKEKSFAMVNFAGIIGLNRLVVDAQSETELARVEHRITVMKGLGEDIASALEHLQSAASSGT